MALFSSKSKKPKDESPEAESGDESQSQPEEVAAMFSRDTRKARPWFDRAHTVADTRNYDYAIECFVSGLRYDPDNIEAHEALSEVAKRRMINKGKKPGLAETMKSGGKTALEKMLYAEMLWAKDPQNTKYMQTVMERAIEAEEETDDDIVMAEVARWMGTILLDVLINNKKTSKAQYLKMVDLFEMVPDWNKALDAARYALREDPNDGNLLHRIKNIQAEVTMAKARYQEGAMTSVKDIEEQRAFDAADQRGKSETRHDALIQRYRSEYEEDPEDVDRAKKLIGALVEKGTSTSENEAIQILNKLWQETGQYSYKMRMGDLRMRQFNRDIRELRDHLRENPDDEQTRRVMMDLATKQVQFELEEYNERVKNYPTDMGLRFQLGRRLLAVKRYDEAIAEFQQARADPKMRAQALHFLGRCYVAKDWTDEAIDALREGIATHRVPGDQLSLEMRYDLMKALWHAAEKGRNVSQAREAQKVASEILQTNINFRDIRECLEQIRKLVEQLQSGESGGGEASSEGGTTGAG